jgi:deoxyribodipyrimidine photo-lyase
VPATEGSASSLPRPSIVLFTRDLRIHDNPALHAAQQAGDVVPLFVLDDALLAGAAGTPNRLAFLAGSLADLHSSLHAAGSGLLTRRGAWVDEVLAAARDVGAGEIHLADDYSGFARNRLAALDAAAGAGGVRVVRHSGVTVVPPGEVVPVGRDAYNVFTPYWRAWTAHRWRSVVGAPRAIRTPAALPAAVRDDIEAGPARLVASLPAATATRALFEPGETAARARVTRWRASGLADYGQNHDDLAAAATSNLSAYFKWGCLSVLEVAVHLQERPGGEEFVRQLCWRDFFHQVAAPQPRVLWENHREPPKPPLRHGAGQAERYAAAWRDGQTGYPLVDAAMRQLHEEGFVHNRARMVAASFLTRDLDLPWWDGARHYLDHLVDGDVIVNNMNWQWVAGTGTDTNRHRTMSPIRQAERFDAHARYITRYLPEFAGLEPKNALQPDADTRARLGYPPPIVEPASSRRGP